MLDVRFFAKGEKPESFSTFIIALLNPYCLPYMLIILWYLTNFPLTEFSRSLQTLVARVDSLERSLVSGSGGRRGHASPAGPRGANGSPAGQRAGAPLISTSHYPMASPYSPGQHQLPPRSSSYNQVNLFSCILLVHLGRQLYNSQHFRHLNPYLLLPRPRRRKIGITFLRACFRRKNHRGCELDV